MSSPTGLTRIYTKLTAPASHDRWNSVSLARGSSEITGSQNRKVPVVEVDDGDVIVADVKLLVDTALVISVWHQCCHVKNDLSNLISVTT